MPDAGFAETLIERLTPLPWHERIRALSTCGDYRSVFSTSFSYEDQAITHAIATEAAPVQTFAIDTGRLFEKTYETFQKTQEAYPQLAIETYYPDAGAAQNLVQKNGINGFYESLEKRKSCCYVRKVEPLERALKGADIWISGLRREHSENRSDLPVAEFDAGRGIIKLYPLVDVSIEEVKLYLKTNDVPYNPMHEEGYPSIGCAPCTRAIASGEHPRAGRWWWEQDNKQECGLHVVDGKLVQASGI